MPQVNRSKQGLIRITSIASAALMSLALLAGANSNLKDDAGRSIWGGAGVAQCNGKTVTSQGPYACDYSKPPEQGGCPTALNQASGTGNSCVQTQQVCQNCTGFYNPTCGGGGPN